MRKSAPYHMRYVLAHQEARRRAAQAIEQAPAGYVVTIKEPTKRRAQEEKYHAMIGDTAKQWVFMGQLWDREDMKRLLIDLYAENMRQLGKPLKHDGRVVPSLDGRRIVQLGLQSRRFTKEEASDFIEFLYALGVEKNIVWSDECGPRTPSP